MKRKLAKKVKPVLARARSFAKVGVLAAGIALGASCGTDVAKRRCDSKVSEMRNFYVKNERVSIECSYSWSDQHSTMSAENEGVVAGDGAYFSLVSIDSNGKVSVSISKGLEEPRVVVAGVGETVRATVDGKTYTVEVCSISMRADFTYKAGVAVAEGAVYGNLCTEENRKTLSAKSIPLNDEVGVSLVDFKSEGRKFARVAVFNARDGTSTVLKLRSGEAVEVVSNGKSYRVGMCNGGFSEADSQREVWANIVVEERGNACQ